MLRRCSRTSPYLGHSHLPFTPTIHTRLSFTPHLQRMLPGRSPGPTLPICYETPTGTLRRYSRASHRTIWTSSLTSRLEYRVRAPTPSMTPHTHRRTGVIPQGHTDTHSPKPDDLDVEPDAASRIQGAHAHTSTHTPNTNTSILRRAHTPTPTRPRAHSHVGIPARARTRTALARAREHAHAATL